MDPLFHVGTRIVKILLSFLGGVFSTEQAIDAATLFSTLLFQLRDPRHDLVVFNAPLGNTLQLPAPDSDLPRSIGDRQLVIDLRVPQPLGIVLRLLPPPFLQLHDACENLVVFRAALGDPGEFPLPDVQLALGIGAGQLPLQPRVVDALLLGLRLAPLGILAAAGIALDSAGLLLDRLRQAMLLLHALGDALLLGGQPLAGAAFLGLGAVQPLLGRVDRPLIATLDRFIVLFLRRGGRLRGFTQVSIGANVALEHARLDAEGLAEPPLHVLIERAAEVDLAQVWLQALEGVL